MSHDIRRHKRRLADAKVHLSWSDDHGRQIFVRGRCVDISQSGMRVAVSDQVPVRAIVNFQVEGLHFRGSATVRSCTRVGMTHHAGLEFSGGIKWTALDIDDESTLVAEH
ncbi:MAG: PilZ domain-containing protein [Bryobacteraceae bacterium]